MRGPGSPYRSQMNMTVARFLTPVAAALVLATGPAANASDEDEPQVPEPVEICLSCHAIAADEPVLEGPTLWQVVGRRIADAPDYEYSDALRKLQGTWDRETLDRFLAAPQAFAPGVNMTFSGVRSAADRKVVLDFLETLTAKGGD